MTEKNIVDLFEQVSKEFDTPKRLNRAPNYRFNEEFMEKLKEDGLTLEMLEEIQDKVRIFKCKTQITIHGQFPQTQIQRIYGYKNCFRNDYGTLGIRYNAIDVNKKLELSKMLALVEEHKELNVPCLRRNSGEMVFTMQSRSLEPIEEMYKRIDTSLFYGRKHAYQTYMPLFGTFYVLEVEIGVFKKDALWSIFTNWTGMKKKEYELLKSQVEKQERKNNEAAEIEKKEKGGKARKDHATATEQLAHLSKWDGNIHPNTILVRGLMNPKAVIFQFVYVQQGFFGRFKVSFQNTAVFRDFNPDKFNSEKTMSAKDLKLELDKKEWFVYQAGGKPQVQPKETPKQVTSPAHPSKGSDSSKIKGEFEYFYYGKGTALFGDTKPHKELLGANGFRGRFNPGLTHPVTGLKTAGWVFSANPQKVSEIESTFSVTCQTTATDKAA